MSGISRDFFCVRNKSAIETFLRRDPYLHLYSIGDLDDFFWPHTSWFGCRGSEGELQALFLFYTASSLPVLLALEEHGTSEACILLKKIAQFLPGKFYCHASPGLVDALSSLGRLESHGRHLRMGLDRFLPPSAYLPPSGTIRRLGPVDLGLVKDFYRSAYPDNWFEERMLETKKYFGMFLGNDLVSIAGVHVYSEAYGTAALGNIATRARYRGRGFAKNVTAALIEDVINAVSLVGLNVSCENRAAIKCYQSLGFRTRHLYEEFLVYR